MAVLDILTYPEKSLKEPSVTVDTIDEEIRTLVENMGQTMFAAPGIGLAAPQVGVNKRIIVYDVNAGSPDRENLEPEFRALINPEIISSSGSIVSEAEGCLSVVDYTADVKRYEQVVVKALDIDGNPIELNVSGIEAVIMQHEIDHLDGVLFIDRISVLKRAMYKKKIKKTLKKQDK